MTVLHANIKAFDLYAESPKLYSLSFAAHTYMCILFLPDWWQNCTKSAQLFLFSCFNMHTISTFGWLSSKERNGKATLSIPLMLSFSAYVLVNKESNTNRKIYDRVPIFLKCLFITFSLYLMQILIQMASVASENPCPHLLSCWCNTLSCSCFEFCWSPKYQGSTRIQHCWVITNTMKKGQQGMVDMCIEWESLLLIFMLHCPIRLHCKTQVQRYNCLNFQDIKSRDIKPSTKPSDCRDPSNGSFVPMQLTLVLLLSSLKSSWIFQMIFQLTVPQNPS